MNKEHLALRNKFRVTKKLLIAKFDSITFFLVKVFNETLWQPPVIHRWWKLAINYTTYFKVFWCWPGEKYTL